jgi:hypothetical protein
MIYFDIERYSEGFTCTNTLIQRNWGCHSAPLL